MSKDRVLFNVIGYLFITLLAVACVLPFIMVISGSLTAEESIIQKGYSVFPREFSLNAYRLALKAPEKILRAYGVTTFVTVVGTFLGLLITSMTAYVLQRKDFSWRNKFAYFFFFTTLFSGGLVPWYVLMVKYLHLKNSIAAVILPGMLSVFNILIMRNFMSGVDVDDGSHLSMCQDFYANCIENGVDFDVIGLSYYTTWCGSLDQLSETMTALAERYGKPVCVVENSQPWCSGEYTFTGETEKYPCTVLGQKQFLTELLTRIKRVPDGLGIGYFAWEPFWIEPAEKNYQWNNGGFVDFEGNVLDTIHIFRNN